MLTKLTDLTPFVRKGASLGDGGRSIDEHAAGGDDTTPLFTTPPRHWCVSRRACAPRAPQQVEGAFQGMVASSSVLNAPNCSVPCEGEKNREPCAVAGLCGEVFYQ